MNSLDGYGEDAEKCRDNDNNISEYVQRHWDRINRTQRKCLERLCELFCEGTAIDNPEVQSIIDKTFKLISGNFLDYGIDTFSHLGNMYVSNKSFAASFDRMCPGLAQYYNNAIQYYCINNK